MVCSVGDGSCLKVVIATWTLVDLPEGVGEANERCLRNVAQLPLPSPPHLSLPITTNSLTRAPRKVGEFNRSSTLHCLTRVSPSASGGWGIAGWRLLFHPSRCHLRIIRDRLRALASMEDVRGTWGVCLPYPLARSILLRWIWIWI